MGLAQVIIPQEVLKRREPIGHESLWCGRNASQNTLSRSCHIETQKLRKGPIVCNVDEGCGGCLGVDLLEALSFTWPSKPSSQKEAERFRHPPTSGKSLVAALPRLCPYLY